MASSTPRTQRAVVVGERPVAGHQAGHSSRASRTISARTAAYSRSAAARIRSGVSVSERIVWRIFAREEVAAQPALALARGQDDVAQVRLERGEGRPRAVSAAACSRGVTAATAGSVGAAASASASASSMSSLDRRRAG